MLQISPLVCQLPFNFVYSVFCLCSLVQFCWYLCSIQLFSVQLIYDTLIVFSSEVIDIVYFKSIHFPSFFCVCVWFYIIGAVGISKQTLFFFLNFILVVTVQLLSHVWLFVTSWTTVRPGFSVLHYVLELDQTHVHWVSDTIQSFCPLLPLSSPALSLSQHQGLF